jgi:hypothetical protein
MAEKIKYECQKCGSIKELLGDTQLVPQCCGRPMLIEEPVDVCETSFSAEDSRMDNLGGPCDDGRSGKI